MYNPWKLATIGMGLVGITMLGTGMTTAYLMRPALPAEAQSTEMLATPRALTPAGYAARRTTPAGVSQPATVSRPVPVATTASRPRATTVSAPVTTVSTPADCDTGGERAWRIAKPGLVGGLLGAGMGAAGGAIADGGKGAGKGALIGGLVGAAGGTALGAYQTKNECGTIFGDVEGANLTPAIVRDAPVTQALHAGSGRAGGAETITIYNAR